MNCSGCVAYVEGKRHCHRFPRLEEKQPDDWCMEFKAREVKQDAVEERKVESSGVTEHQRVNALWATTEAGDSHSDEQGREKQEQEETVKKRGWPRGKPRK